MDAALRAGIALYNAGEHHAAHDPWEHEWLDLETGTDDERLLHGLIQFTAAIYHARTGNWDGATGLAASADDYLAGLDTPYRGVDVAAPRRAMATLATDPAVIERRRPPPLRYKRQRLRLADLAFEGVAAAAPAIAAEHEYDEATVDRAVTYAREEVANGDRTLFTGPLFEFVTAEEPHRALVARRLRHHVDRRDRKHDDAAGLFD
jgi:hypothetical protein